MAYIGELCVEHQLTSVFTFVQVGVSCKWAHDSQRLLLESFDIIQNSPSQIYHYILPFSPSSSWLHKSYTTEPSRVVKVANGLTAGWGSCFRTVALGGKPMALACWKETIAVGLTSGDIVVLDAITGSWTAVLAGHTGYVRSVTFSSDGTSLVSGGNDGAVNLWDVQTGGVVKTFHSAHYVGSVSISSNHTTIASGSEDSTIRLWDIQTGECHHIISQKRGVEYVAFFPTNPQHLISISQDVVQWWDVNGHQIKPVSNSTCAAFSPDGTHLVLCEGGVTTVQDSGSGATVAKFPTGSDSKHFCLSPNGRLVGVAAGATAYVWDITGSDPLLIETFTGSDPLIGAFIGHEHDITFLTFSSSSTLISAYENQSVKFWQIDTSSTDLFSSNPKSTRPASASIQSVSLQPGDGIAMSGDSDGVVKIWDISTGLCKTTFQTPAKGSLRDAQMVDGRLIVVWLEKGGMHIWNMEEGEEVVEGYFVRARDIRISEDGSKVFVLFRRRIGAWSIWTGQTMGWVEFDDSSCMFLLRMGGSRMCVHSEESLTMGWDFGISDSPPCPIA
jgi:WD40 repeat protein